MNGSSRTSRPSVIPACAGMTAGDSRSTARRWRWAQDWRELLFAHWPVPLSALRRCLPAEVEIDTWHGHAWVSAVAFRLTTRLAGWPSVPFVSSFLELNLRTYVRERDQPAVWFLSMHGSSKPAVWLGRRLTPLPYLHAPIRLRQDGHQRQFLCGDALRPLFAADFRPFGETRWTVEGTLDSWLTERYAAVVAARNGNLLRMVVDHPKWEIQPAAARVDAGRLGRQFDLDLNRPPELVHYSEGVAATVSSFEPCWSTQSVLVD